MHHEKQKQRNGQVWSELGQLSALVTDPYLVTYVRVYRFSRSLVVSYKLQDYRAPHWCSSTNAQGTRLKSARVLLTKSVRRQVTNCGPVTAVLGWPLRLPNSLYAFRFLCSGLTWYRSSVLINCAKTSYHLPPVPIVPGFGQDSPFAVL